MARQPADGGKGDKPRVPKISRYEEDLRWELFRSTTTDERRIAIKKELEEIKSNPKGKRFPNRPLDGRPIETAYIKMGPANASSES